MQYRLKTLAAWFLTAAILLSLLPRTARAAAVSYAQITAQEDLVSGQYVLRSSDGSVPAYLADDWLLLLEVEELTDCESFLWTLEVSPEGVLLTDSQGNTIAPGANGLVAGEYRWNVTFVDGMFSFHSQIEETTVTLARFEDVGFQLWDGQDSEASYDTGFALYRLTEQEEVPTEPTSPSEEPTEATEPTEKPTDPTDPSEEPTDPTEPSEEPTDPTDPSEEPTNPTEPSEDPTEPEEPELPAGPGLFFGQLHSHTADSDGSGTPEEAFAYAKEVAGLDFLAVTDHSNSLDGAANAALNQDAASISQTWKQGREAAKAATSGSFLALYGFEMTWQNGLGHISTFFTPGFLSRDQDAFQSYGTALDAYYRELSAVPGSISQFNHPGSAYGDFEAFGHLSDEADAAMALLEVVSEGTVKYDAYTKALDLGWHVAPTNNQNNHAANWGTADSGRTVVYAESLTEEAFAEALRSRRVYATEDDDLEILYRLDNFLFGSMLTRRNVGDTVTLTASVSDPTDASIGTVEVIVDGGRVAASQTLNASNGEIQFSLPASYNYYYLRITQPDGDIAVTAPVWIEQRQPLQITAFTADTAMPTANKAFTLRVTVKNPDSATLDLDKITFSIGGKTLGTISNPTSVPGYSSQTYSKKLTWKEAGAATIQVNVTGSIDGEAMSASSAITLNFLTEELTATIVADGSFGTLPGLSELEALAAQSRMELVRTDSLTAEILSPCEILLVPAPDRNFDQSYIALLSDYLRSGKTLILCGAGDASAPGTAARLNRLAETLGLSARFRDDLAFDPENNGGRVDEIQTTVYNGQNITEPFCQKGGCTLEPGQGTWLVKGHPTAFSIDGDDNGAQRNGEVYTQVVEGRDVVRHLVASAGNAVLLVRETAPSGGTVYLSGGMFLGDDVLHPGGASLWDPANGNAAFLRSLLDIPAVSDPMQPISLAQARNAAEGETVRVRGYVTAGTAVECNRFPNMIYIQDDTAGLGVLDFAISGVSVSTPVELYLIRKADGFHLLHWEKRSIQPCNIQPAAPGAVTEQYADQLVKAEGKVVARTLTENGLGLSAFTLEDKAGNRVTVSVESQIGSASTGKNTLAETVAEGSWVSAVGIVYVSNGQTVLRVRNCDEITAVREQNKVYRVVDGAYSCWVPKEGKSLYMEVEGPGEEFLGIEVDGVMIDQGHYQTTRQENLLFRFWPRYLKTLSLGTHTVVFKFRSGEATATLSVQNQAGNPPTGDTIAVPLILMLLSGGMLLTRRRKRK